MSGDFRPKLLGDATAQELAKYDAVLPPSDQNFETVANLIWCIESRYANTIVEAKQWIYVKTQLERYNNEMRRARARQEEAQKRLIEEYEKGTRVIANAVYAAGEKKAAELKAQREELKKLNQTAEKQLEIEKDIRSNSNLALGELEKISNTASNIKYGI